MSGAGDLDREIADLARLCGGGAALRDALEEIRRSGASDNSVRRIMRALRSAIVERVRPEWFRELGAPPPPTKAKARSSRPRAAPKPRSEHLIEHLIEKRIEAVLVGLLGAQIPRRTLSPREAALALYADTIITKIVPAMLNADPSLSKQDVLRIFDGWPSGSAPLDRKLLRDARAALALEHPDAGTGEINALLAERLGVTPRTIQTYLQ